MVVGRREDPRLRSSPLTFGNSQLQKFNDDRGEAKHNMFIETMMTLRRARVSLLEEKRFVSGVGLDPLLKRLVLDKRIVRSEGINGDEAVTPGLDACGE